MRLLRVILTYPYFILLTSLSLLLISLLYLFHHLAFGFHVFRHPQVCTNHRPPAYCDAAQYSGVGIYDNVVFQYGVAWYAFDGVAVVVERETLCPKCYSLIQFHVVTYDTCGSYHHTGAVVYREVVADTCSGMYVDAGFRVCHFRYYPWYQRHAEQ